jgi:hypothetical protein
VTSVLTGTAKADFLSNDWFAAPPPSTHDAAVLYFTGVDLWRKGGSAYGGVVWSPGGLNRDGFTLKALLAGGDYLYRSSATDIRGADLVASIMPGYRLKRGNVEIKMFAGLDIQHHWTLPFDPSNRLRGTHAGARFNTLTGSTIDRNYGIRAAAGWRMFNRLWLGPEIETSGDRIYRQYRAGAHITSLQFGGFEWALSAGYVRDNDSRSGMYGRFSLLARR